MDAIVTTGVALDQAVAAEINELRRARRTMAIMRLTIHLAACLLLGFAIPTMAGTTLFHASSKEMGIQEFDLTVTETARNPRTSVLSVPGYHQRSAAASRWLMCAYTDLALERGFKFWAVVSPEPPSEVVLVGFPKSEHEDLSKSLGPRFVGDAAMVASTEVMSSLCGV